ncbi:12 TM domain-containing transmembrane protein [Acrasis kona]|uniref:Endosomal/lysosomal proton channel TMEM175 n=1 Tax=Acrasis kona TaxID=1008807 RepID=A0AAW2YI41_9EUKA
MPFLGPTQTFVEEPKLNINSHEEEKSKELEQEEMQLLLHNYLAKHYDEQKALKEEEKEATETNSRESKSVRISEDGKEKEESVTDKVFKDLIEINRIKFISDGVLAVVLTLLVLELKVPTAVAGEPSVEVTSTILGMWSEILTYIIVTAYIAVFWTAHVYTFSVIQTSDSVIAFLNILFLMFSSFLPWVTSVVRAWPLSYISSLLINGTLFCIGLSLLIIWLYSIYKRRFVHDENDLPNRALVIVTMRFAFSPIVYLISLIVAPFHPITSLSISAVVPTVFIISNMGIDLFETTYRLSRYARIHILKIKNKGKSPHLNQENPAPGEPTIPDAVRQESMDKADKVKIVEKKSTEERVDSVTSDKGDIAITVEDSRTIVVDTEVDTTIIQKETITVDPSMLDDDKDDELENDDKRTKMPKSTSSLQLKITTVMQDGSITMNISREDEPFVSSSHFHDLVMERIKGFSDAIFAIVITILVLKLHAPKHNSTGVDDDHVLGEKIMEEIPLLAAFFISVLITGNLWKLHIYVLKPVVRTSRLFLFVNIIFLALVSLIPFTADLLGKWRSLIVSSVTFNILLAVCSMSLFSIFYVANFHRGGLRSAVSTKYIVVSFIRIVFGPIVNCVAVGVAFHSVSISIMMSLIVVMIEVLAAFQLDLYLFLWRAGHWFVKRFEIKSKLFRKIK